MYRDIRGFNNSTLICRYSQQRIMGDYYQCVSATMTAAHKSPNITDQDLHCFWIVDQLIYLQAAAAFLLFMP